MKLTAVDLFCGAGGMSLGLQNAGFEVLAGFDNWESAVSTYSQNFGHDAHLIDLGSAQPEDILQLIGQPAGTLDLLAGGPPCQGFSIQRIGEDADPRNDLVVHFGRLIVGTRPKTFLMENVPGLLGRRGRDSFARFVNVISEGGYEYDVLRVDAVEFGVPQRRPRVLVYGWRRGLDDPGLRLSGLAHRPVTVAEALASLPPAAAPGTVDAEDPLHVESRLSEKNRERLQHIPPGGGFEDLPIELRVDCHRNGASKIGHRAVYGRLHPDRPSNVITARFDSFTRGRFAHPTEDRNITLREGARLQSFPDEFRFYGNREQIAALIGNAVPPLVAARVGAAISDHIIGVQPAADNVN
ncbi:DNA cytosine methyltransferase [Nocardia canadensis]|uniref:DNA cytosine methyltransferase n=1 Tax=Nocardia canadensis TaxID=3065238 RepID=UPI00292D74E6|nr:DNA cytosine methyltransferase [Nocardia canadensis]